MAGLQKLPIVSVLLVVAMVAAPFVLVGAEVGPSKARFQEAQQEAREFFVRRPGLSVDAAGALTLGETWIEEARAAEAASESVASIELPGRMLARSQAKLDELIDVAYEARMLANPAWRFGVLDQNTPVSNYWMHPFIHEVATGMALSVAVLLLAGMLLERSWGSLVFAAFCILSVAATAQAYRVLDASSGIPWSGGAGLAGAVLGAYFIRGLGGHFMIPGWMLLPVWLGVEALVVRGVWVENFDSMPWASVFASLAVGALVAGGFRIIGLEARLDSIRAKSADRGPHPIVSRAARLRSDGDPHQAFDLLQSAWRETPQDQDVAEAFFSIAVEVGQPQAAAEAIVPSLRKALRSGDVAAALEYWLPIITAGADVSLEATASVRLGEALLDAGHPQQALRSLRGALEQGVSSAHAIRIVHIARDLDEDLARQAAEIALSDRSLDDARRRELEAILNRPAREPDDETDPTPSSAVSDGQLGRRVAAEHHPVDVTAFPDESSASISPGSNDGQASVGQHGTTQILSEGASSQAQAAETQIVAQNLDPSALSADGLSAEVGDSGDLEEPNSGDVLSHWGDDDAFGDIDQGARLGPDLGPTPDLDLGQTLLGESDSDFFDTSPSLSIDDQTDRLDPFDVETDSDLTPLMDAGDLTGSFDAGAQSDELTMLAGMPDSPLGEASALPFADQQTMIANLPPVRDEQLALEQTVVRTAEPIEGASAEDFEIGVVAPSRPLRELRALNAVPNEASEDTISIDVEGHGKSKLPLDRVEVIVVAAIDGLASRPVLLVDFGLNWAGDSSEPLKVIRFRSDRFDPRQFEPGEIDPLKALTAWVRRLQLRSQANCLPSRAILEGRFMRYASVEAYEAEVLTAMREA